MKKNIIKQGMDSLKTFNAYFVIGIFLCGNKRLKNWDKNNYIDQKDLEDPKYLIK